MQERSRQAKALRSAAWDINRLPESDRDWILARLSSSELERVRALVGHGAMGTAADTNAAPVRSGGGARRHEPPPKERPNLVAAVEALPEWLAARVLESMNDEDRSQVLDALGRPRGRALARFKSGDRTARSLTETARRALLDSVGEIGFARPAPAQPGSMLARWRSRLRGGGAGGRS